MDDLPLTWFNGALLNYAENLLHCDDSEKIAIYSQSNRNLIFVFVNICIFHILLYEGEAFTKTRSITFKNLRSRVHLYQAKLKKLGIKRGDRVVGYMPNCIEYVEAKLATISLGAVWSCASPDFGSQVKYSRF